MIPTPEMKKMRAFHGKESIKEKYVNRLKAHAKADAIVKGQYWEGGKGCAVGCTIEGREHKRYETELGIPEAIAHVEDYLFETMPNEDAKEFPLRLLEAIPVGADLSLVSANLIIYMLDDTLNLKEVQGDSAVKSSIKTVIDLWKKVRSGETVESAAWSAAESAAWSAARSAARSAAESAAWSAARSAAESAAAKRYGDALIRICSEAPVIEQDVEDDVTEEAIALLREKGYKIVKD